jgi:hypothetical protein
VGDRADVTAFSAGQILGALASHGIAPVVTKNVAVGYTINWNGTLSPEQKRIVDANKTKLVRALVGDVRCACGKPATKRYFKRVMGLNDFGMRTVIMDENYLCDQDDAAVGRWFKGYTCEQISKARPEH